jgi:uncharacterized protein YcsI (UPF0317 family)
MLAFEVQDMDLVMFDPSDDVTLHVLWSGLNSGLTQVSYSIPSSLTFEDAGFDNGVDPRVSRIRVSGAMHGGSFPCVATATLQDATTATVRFTIRGFNA